MEPNIPVPTLPKVTAAVSTPSPAKVPFFDTAVGKAVVKIVITGVLWIVSAIAKDPTVVHAVLGIGGVTTILTLATDLADGTVSNLP
jgi:hypothetical protein